MSTSELAIQQRLDFLIANAVKDALAVGLSDELGANVIHVDSSIPQLFNLSITNKLTEGVEIVGQPGPPNPQNYHFHIQFVNNECFLDEPAPTMITDNWLMTCVADDAHFITDIYLLSKTDITLAASSLKGSTTGVQLKYIKATLNNVAVDVLQVAVTVGQNVNALIKPNSEPVTGTTTIHLSTFTDAGAPSPLIPTLVQSKTILNDGVERRLLLRLVNTSSVPVAFAPPPDQGGTTPTKIELRVDLDATAAWALCTKGEAELIRITPPSNWCGDPAGKTGTTQKTWEFWPVYTKPTKIDPHSVLEFTVTGVKTTLPPGFTNLYVTFREFPLYGTQTAVAQIEKSPLIYNPNLASGLLSKGSVGPNHALALEGNTTAELLMVSQSGTGNSAHFKGGAGVNIENNLVVSGDGRLDDGVFWLRKAPDNYGIGVYGGANNRRSAFAKQNVDGPVVFGLKGGALGSTDGGEKIALAWKSTGKVGIGTSEPKSLFSVKGGMAVGSNYADAQEASPNSLLVEGSIGVGTNAPKSALSVKGGVAVGSTYADKEAAPADGLVVQGKVGVGTTAPATRLQLGNKIIDDAGRAYDPDTLMVVNQTPTKTATLNDPKPVLHLGRQGTASQAYGAMATFSLSRYENAGTNGTGSRTRLDIGLTHDSFSDAGVMTLLSNGNVGIGTATPTKGKLHVSGAAKAGSGQFAYFAYRSTEKAPFTGIASEADIFNSIWAEDRIAGSEFNAFSDVRIKNVIGPSDGAQDLATLMQIEVVDYTYKDTVARGNRLQKKLIGQQLRDVFGQAASVCTDVVPDIFQNAECLDNWIDINTTLQPGDRVRIILENGTDCIVEVADVEPNRFRVSPSLVNGPVFVYGREVKDFVNVDYDAIAMLNVSATQQIKREKDGEVQALREENASLRARLERLESLIESLVPAGAFKLSAV